MVYLLGGLCAVLALTTSALAVKVVLLRRAARELREGLTERLEGEDTNTLLTLPTRDRDMRALASDLNGQLRLLRERRHRYQQGDLTVKEAVTEVAHDLRTPLTAIRGYLDLLEGDVPAEDRARYHSLIRRRVEGMTELTEELLRTSLVLSAPQPPAVEPVDLRAALEESLAAFYAAFQRRGVTPQVTLPPEQVVRSLDREALSRVLGNILSNALKYSAGDLRVVLSPAGSIAFSNSAPELTAVTAQRLFDRYFTVETGRRSTGLGLAIARRLTEAMGGTVEAAYQDGTLTVIVDFPENF